MPSENKRPAPSSAGGASKKSRTDRDVQKFYAVRTGRKPGVYLLWPECQRQIDGFKGAQYKSFLSRSDAEAFVAGKNPNPPAAAKSGVASPPKFYAVARGSFTGIFTDWDTASKAVAGTKGPKYKKFETRAEAVDFIEQWGDQETIKKVKTGGTGTGTKKTVKTTSEKPSADILPGMLTIYTDGSSLANGRAGAAAGLGVFFGLDDPRNLSERLVGEPQTNQRAELSAILRALQIADTDQDVQILTDSQYSINCVTDWYKNWMKRDWHTATGAPVKNKDLVQLVREQIDEREDAGAKTVFTWVKGHADSLGNQAADSLAVAGAKL